MSDRPSNDSAPELSNQITALAQRHHFSNPAAWAAFEALRRGRGRMAQFDCPELGGMGQWSPGGMVMIGDMFNHDLKARVNALCIDLAQLLADQPESMPASLADHAKDAAFDLATAMSQGSHWWPRSLGAPTAVGSQNSVRYAYFPQARRLAVEQRGQLTIYDTGEHRITGFSQQQDPDSACRFVSQLGEVSLQDLSREHY